jgi:hypothetical protein
VRRAVITTTATNDARKRRKKKTKLFGHITVPPTVASKVNKGRSASLETPSAALTGGRPKAELEKC